MGVTKKDLTEVISKIENNNFKLYFFLPDFEKHSGGIQWVYNHVKTLRQEGFNAIILHQKKDFMPEWLKDWFEQDDKGNFVDLKFQYLEDGELKVNMEDYFFIPEGFPVEFEDH